MFVQISCIVCYWSLRAKMTSSWLTLSLTLAWKCLLPPPSMSNKRQPHSRKHTQHITEELMMGRPGREGERWVYGVQCFVEDDSVYTKWMLWGTSNVHTNLQFCIESASVCRCLPGWPPPGLSSWTQTGLLARTSVHVLMHSCMCIYINHQHTHTHTHTLW